VVSADVENRNCGQADVGPKILENHGSIGASFKEILTSIIIIPALKTGKKELGKGKIGGATFKQELEFRGRRTINFWGRVKLSKSQEKRGNAVLLLRNGHKGGGGSRSGGLNGSRPWGVSHNREILQFAPL